MCGDPRCEVAGVDKLLHRCQVCGPSRSHDTSSANVLSIIYTDHMATLEPDNSTTFLAIGDVHGHWDCVIEAIATAEVILGKVPDLVLQVGDAEPHRNEEDLAGCHTPKKYRSIGDFSALRQGDIRSPLYFIGGNYGANWVVREKMFMLIDLPAQFRINFTGELVL